MPGVGVTYRMTLLHKNFTFVMRKLSVTNHSTPLLPALFYRKACQEARLGNTGWRSVQRERPVTSTLYIRLHHGCFCCASLVSPSSLRKISVTLISVYGV